jgi:hypothetical protein
MEPGVDELLLFQSNPQRSESMKRNALSMALLLTLSLIAFSLFGCQPSAPDTNRVATAPATPTPETVDPGAIQAELTRIENDFPRVLKEKDVAAIERVEADDIVVIYPDGSVGNKAQDVTDIREGNLSADSWVIAEMKVVVLDKDAAVATGKSVVKGGKMKGPNGKTLDISGQYRWIDTFARRNGEWKLVATVSIKVTQPVPEVAASPSPKASPAPKASPSAEATPPAKASPTKKASPAATKPTP